jgi:predicted dehydrogenase
VTGVAVIGTGFGARVVAPAFAAAGCTVVGVVSPREPADVYALIGRREVDLVSVHSPPFLHADHVRAALVAGKHVLCDKPFSMNAEEAAALESEAADAGVVALCNFEFRYAPARARLRALIREGALGRIEHVQWTHLSSGSRVPLRPWGWLFDRDRGGGWIGAWASHAVDTIRFMFGEVVDTRSRPRTDIGARPDAEGVMRVCTAEDGLTAWLELDGGVTVAIDSSFAAPVTIAPRLTVSGSGGIAELVSDERLTLRRTDGSETREAFAAGTDHHATPMARLAAAAAAATTETVAAAGLPTFADGRACDQVLERLRTST